MTILRFATKGRNSGYRDGLKGQFLSRGLVTVGQGRDGVKERGALSLRIDSP
jgi:hypothetical protein